MRHSAASRPPSTRTVMNLVAPSPSRTIACASCARHVGMRGREQRHRAARRHASMSAVRGLAGRDHHEGIVGRRVAVDGDAVERRVGELARQLRCSSGGSIVRVGRDEAQHRRHVRADHAGALADAGDRDRRAADRAPARLNAFGTVSVVMMRFGRAQPVVGASASAIAGRQPGLDALDRQRLHDHAGGKRQHLLGRRSRACRASARRCARARARPSSPVPALALPVLITSARMPPPPPGARGRPAPARRRNGSA